MRATLISLAAVSLLVAAYCCGLHRGKAAAPAPEIIRDTVVLRDTIVTLEPVIVTQRVTDTLEIEVLTVQHDTITAYLPREEVTYEDSSYTAIVSGVQPRLDYLAIYPEVRTITVTETINVPTAQRWGIGLQAGYGLTLADKKICAAPYIGVGVSWNLLTF